MTSLGGNDGLEPLACQVSQGQWEGETGSSLCGITEKESQHIPMSDGICLSCFHGGSAQIFDIIYLWYHIFRLVGHPRDILPESLIIHL